MCTFDASTREAEAGGFLRLQSTGIHCKVLLQNEQTNKTTTTKTEINIQLREEIITFKKRKTENGKMG